MIDKTATQASRQDILERFKGYFCTVVGEPLVWSSSESWSDTDLSMYMGAAATFLSILKAMLGKTSTLNVLAQAEFVPEDWEA